MGFKMIDQYDRADGGKVWLRHDAEKNIWNVTSFDQDGEVSWDLTGYNEGGYYEGHRLVGATWHPYTEETARKEFERWRT